jgi:hypothetical protein
MLLVGTNCVSGIVAAFTKVLQSSIAKRPLTSLEFFMFACVQLSLAAASRYKCFTRKTSYTPVVIENAEQTDDLLGESNKPPVGLLGSFVHKMPLKNVFQPSTNLLKVYLVSTISALHASSTILPVSARRAATISIIAHQCNQILI